MSIGDPAGKGFGPVMGASAKSLLAEMFVHGGRSELLRANTRIAALTRATRGVVTCSPVGKGQVILNQYVPPVGADGAPKRVRLVRLIRRLRANLGMQPAVDLLAGNSRLRHR